jgi:hypothetical protein
MSFGIFILDFSLSHTHSFTLSLFLSFSVVCLVSWWHNLMRVCICVCMTSPFFLHYHYFCIVIHVMSSNFFLSLYLSISLYLSLSLSLCMDVIHVILFGCFCLWASFPGATPQCECLYVCVRVHCCALLFAKKNMYLLSFRYNHLCVSSPCATSQCECFVCVCVCTWLCLSFCTIIRRIYLYIFASFSLLLVSHQVRLCLCVCAWLCFSCCTIIHLIFKGCIR